MHPTDARRDLLGDRLPSDLFVLFCFDAPDVPFESVLTELAERVASMGELQVRAVDVPFGLDYPYWTACAVGDDRFVVHERCDYDGVLAVVAGLLPRPVDIRSSPWRLHLFPDVTDAPGGEGPALVAVFRISHAYADGVRASALARTLLAGPTTSSRPPRAPSPLAMVARAALRLPVAVPRVVADGRRAVRAERELADPVIPQPTPGRPLTAVNVAPGRRRTVRTLVLDADDLRKVGTVTVGALTAIGAALSEFLGTDELSAEVPVAVPPTRGSRNHYRNVGVDLHCGIADPRLRARAISEDLAAQRFRARHPAMAVRARTDDHVPAPLMRLGTDRIDLDAVPATVTGNTVVSSVHRGAADLVLGGGRVRFTTGFPGLSPVQSLTHGVHGIGDVVTISVTTSPDVVDQDGLARYVLLLREAIGAL